MIGRSDGRLGEPTPTGEPLDHVCPLCNGEGDSCSMHCYCNGLGVITATQARELAADDPDPRWAPRPLPPVPEYCGRRCSDCAFKAGSLERDGASAADLYEQLELGNDGAPIGHPICAGWVREYERHLNKPPTEMRTEAPMKRVEQTQPEKREPEPAADDDVLDVAGAMALLRMGRNTIYEQCAQNLIPHRRIGRRIRFSRTALLRWLEGERQP